MCYFRILFHGWAKPDSNFPFAGSQTDCPYKYNTCPIPDTICIPDNICLSSRDCNVCKRINGVHEGCNHPFNTSHPVCDLDKDNPGIDPTATRKVAECVKCKKSGKKTIYLFKSLK